MKINMTIAVGALFLLIIAVLFLYLGLPDGDVFGTDPLALPTVTECGQRDVETGTYTDEQLACLLKHAVPIDTSRLPAAS